ncbi:hypothetical protein DPMN_090170 [Dreissena polymorpha]|uniref:Uncharacterized protein n=1 Tax=Dreissena polymorpha TaxID=45954 RepID=A0A9D4KX86_DREPO|nr:hypothetical protein DPMN_090170 [Dreissena polymorpha]
MGPRGSELPDSEYSKHDQEKLCKRLKWSMEKAPSVKNAINDVSLADMSEEEAAAFPIKGLFC